MIEVVPTCGKQGLPFNVEVARCWVTGERRGQKREIGIDNLPSFGNRNVLSRTANVCHPEQSADGDRRRSETSSVVSLAMLQSRLLHRCHSSINSQAGRELSKF